MKKDMLRRIDALERQRLKNQKAAERQWFLTAASQVGLAYNVGGLKPNESHWEGFARALKLQNARGLWRAVIQVLKTENAAELQRRHNDANRQLFAEFRCDRPTQETFEKAITKIAKRLPDQWRAWINEQVETVDYGEEAQQEERAEQLWSKLELMAASEARARSRNGKFA